MTDRDESPPDASATPPDGRPDAEAAQENASPADEPSVDASSPDAPSVEAPSGDAPSAEAPPAGAADRHVDAGVALRQARKADHAAGPAPFDAKAFGLAALFGAAAAAVGAVVWVIAVTHLAPMLLGLVLWGIGTFVGYAAAASGARRGAALACLAAALALGSIGAGRYLAVELEGAEALVSNWTTYPEQTLPRVYRNSGAASDALMARAAAVPPDAELPDDLRRALLAEFRALPEAERTALLQREAERIVEAMAFRDRVLGGLGGFDIFWILLAAASAWGMGRGWLR